LTLSQPKTLEQIVTKFEWRDYVVDDVLALHSLLVHSISA